ncbi:MAG: RNA polymerase sigma factor [Ruminococcus sp.]|nr:RNA polymerase sigma factor [Ruminococcus sp.]
MDNGENSYRRFLVGDKEGLYEIICEYREPLILYLNSIVQNIHIAEELAEDTFFELAARKPDFSGKSSFKTWLYSIGFNIAAKQFRKRANITLVPIDAQEILDEESIEKNYLKNERDRMIHKSLHKLKTEYRQVLYLSFFECLKNEETALIMKKSKRQVENLLYNAKKALRAELERSGYDYEEQ